MWRMSLENIISSWKVLTFQKKILAIAATLFMFSTLFLMTSYAAQPSMSLLYADLEDAAASDVLSALEQRGVKYDVRGSAIYVPHDQKDSLRLDLAGEGLPNNGPRGYELLDALSGFGTTSQMFDATYWRAKEGELARSILASPSISSARVHIAQKQASVFSQTQNVTASVFIVSKSGRPDTASIQAFQHLVASAVPNLDPTSVTIVDSSGILTTGDAQPQNRNSALDISSILKERVTRLLEARVGHGNVVVEVSVDTNNQTEQITERRFDPEGRVAVSTDTEERTSRSEGAEAGLTVASNLPDGEADTTKGSTSADNETRERINYEVSETTREISRQSGDIQRLTVAALINGIVEISPNGTEIFTPLDTQDLTALEELIASAVGFDENRGDLITIHSMQFNNIDFEGTAANDLVWYNNIVDLSSILKIALSGLVSLIIGLTVIRPIFRKNSSVEQENPISLNTLDESLPVLNSDPINFSENTNDLPMLVSEDSVFDQNPPLGTSNENEPALRLKALIDNHKDETIEILESWITENDVKI